MGLQGLAEGDTQTNENFSLVLPACQAGGIMRTVAAGCHDLAHGRHSAKLGQVEGTVASVCARWELSWSCKTWVVGTTGNQCECRKAWGWSAGASEAGAQGWVDRHTSSAPSAPSTFMISFCLCHGCCSKAVVLTQG